MKKALLIGINYLESDTPIQLKGCIKDVEYIKQMLINDLEFQEENIIVLNDLPTSTNKPTGMNILTILQQLVSESQNYSELWIHYSGHGSQITDNNSDETDTKDEVIIPSDYATVGVIRDDTLRFYLNQLKCKTFMVMDCCNSGTNIDLPHHYVYNQNEIVYSNESKYESENTEIYKFSGCLDTQSSYSLWDFETYGYRGACTHALIDTLKEHNYDISYGSLLEKMNEWMVKNMSDQSPTFSSTNQNSLSVNFSQTITNNYTPVQTDEQLLQSKLDDTIKQLDYFKSLYYNTLQDNKQNIDNITEQLNDTTYKLNMYKGEFLTLLREKLNI